MREFSEIISAGVDARLPVLRAELDAAWKEHRFNGFAEAEWKQLRVEGLLDALREVPDSRYGHDEQIEEETLMVLLGEF